jgi:diaminohydroxyphosphoribosylaminopyrimidine deaminase/5-amino-6-(5-phosphoribosylamino)uracil reductase
VDQTGRDEQFMSRALTEGRKGLGVTSPNPAVGAILVRQGRIIARGHHRGAGKAHAEVDCLRKVSDAKAATLYVTLEPCSTHGRTPPCVDYIAQRGLRRVVIGAIDPNPQHRGRAIELLRAGGIEVASGILERECARMNDGFNKWIVTGEPFVIAKCAMSLDGRLTRPPGEAHWLSSATARRHAQRLRTEVDAIVVGAETIRRDNPRLTVRAGPRRKQPLRVVLTRSARLPKEAKVFTDANKERTMVYRGKSLHHVLHDLGKREILSVLIEGGGEVLSQALDQRLIDRFQIYLTPLFTGGNVLAFGGNGAGSTAEAMQLSQLAYERIGNDICMSGYAQPQQ